jgi:hypothetical protein
MKAFETGSGHFAARSYDTRLRLPSEHGRQHRRLEFCRPPRLGCGGPHAPVLMSLTLSNASETRKNGTVVNATQASFSTRVLVLGGSIAGMLAAAAVSPFVEEVLIIDKENALSGAGSEEELRKVGSVQNHHMSIRLLSPFEWRAVREYAILHIPQISYSELQAAPMHSRLCKSFRVLHLSAVLKSTRRITSCLCTVLSTALPLYADVLSYIWYLRVQGGQESPLEHSARPLPIGIRCCWSQHFGTSQAAQRSPSVHPAAWPSLQRCTCFFTRWQFVNGKVMH